MCFIDGYYECAKELLRHDEFDPLIMGEDQNGRGPFEELMINNSFKALEKALYDEDFVQLAETRNLKIFQDNIVNLMAQAIIYNASNCFEILKTYVLENKFQVDDIEILTKNVIDYESS